MAKAKTIKISGRSLLLTSGAASMLSLAATPVLAQSFSQAPSIPSASAELALTREQGSTASAPLTPPSDTPADPTRIAAAGNALGEVVVTATRRQTTVQTTPLAITALDQAALQRNNITDLSKLPLQTPSLFVGGNDGFGGPTVQLRGIGTLDLGVGAEDGVGIYVDGVYQGKPYGDIFDFVDVDRVEVLRGPQGTLYGRNATGGAINVVTKQPGNEFTGQVNADYTSYNGVRASGYVLAPIVEDKLGLKLAFGLDSRDGWAYNTTRRQEVDGFDNRYGSASLRWRPTKDTEVIFAGRIGQSHDTQEQKDVNDRTLPTDVFVDDAAGYDRNRYVSGSVTVNQNLPGMSLVSITGYGASEAVSAQDSDLIAASIIYGTSFQKSRQESEELRLVSKTQGPFSWIIGGLYYHEESSVSLPFVLPAAPPQVNSLLFDGALRTDSYSAYAEGTYKLTSKLSLTAGARYSYDAKHWLGCEGFSPLAAFPSPDTCNSTNTVPDNRHFGATTPHFVLSYQATNRVLLYASATKGFRSGGWNFTEPTSFHSGFTPEDIWSYEGGAKTQFLDRRVHVNLDGYYADYTKLQVRVQDGPFLAVRNAGAARIYGVEFDTAARLLDKLDLSLVGSYLNAEYTDFPTQADGVAVNYAGQRLNRSPQWDVSATAQYEFELPHGWGSLTPRAEYHYAGEVFYSEINVQPLGASPTNIANFRLKYQPLHQPWSVTAYVDNASNDQYRTYATVGDLPGQVAARISDPRIIGLHAQYTW